MKCLASTRPSLNGHHPRHIQSIPRSDALAASKLYRLHLEDAYLYSVKQRASFHPSQLAECRHLGKLLRCRPKGRISTILHRPGCALRRDPLSIEGPLAQALSSFICPAQGWLDRFEGIWF